MNPIIYQKIQKLKEEIKYLEDNKTRFLAEFAEKFLYIAGLRNYLAHEYMKDTAQTLVDFLEHKIEDVKSYLMLIGKYG